jgi:hypothetical protein
MMGFIGATSVMAIRGIWSHLTTPTADIQEYINVIRHCDMQNFVYSQQTNVMQINEVARDCWRGCDMFDKDRDKNAEITSEQQECMNKCTQLRMKFLEKTQEIQHAVWHTSHSQSPYLKHKHKTKTEKPSVSYSATRSCRRRQLARSRHSRHSSRHDDDDLSQSFPNLLPMPHVQSRSAAGGKRW